MLPPPRCCGAHATRNAKKSSQHPAEGELRDAVETFWLDPSSSEVLAQVGSGEGTRTLWRSADGGQHWTHLSDQALSAHAPSMPLRATRMWLDAQVVARWDSSGGSTLTGYVVQARVSGQPWHICAWAYSLNDPNGAPNVLRCSDDGGQIWRTRTGPNLVRNTYVQRAAIVGLADDGAVLATISAGGQPPILFRLAADETRWQSLGQAGPEVTYCHAPAPGTLWDMSGGRVATTDYA